MTDPCSLNPGELRHLVTFAPPTGTDASGQQTYGAGVAIPAKIENVQQTKPESYQMGALSSPATQLIITRYFSPVDASYQVTDEDGHTYKIQTIYNVDHRNRVLKFLVYEINPSE